MKKELVNYYVVVAKCGHVGRKHYIPINFSVIAENGKEAAKKVRMFPRVKHDHKDAILSVRKVSYEEYLEVEKINNNDMYLQCKNKQEQLNIVNFEDRLIDDHHGEIVKYENIDRKARIKYKNKKFQIILKQSSVVDYYGYVY